MNTSCCVWAVKLCLLRKVSDDWKPVKSKTRASLYPQKLPLMLVRVGPAVQEANQGAWQHHNCSDKAVLGLTKVLLHFYGVYHPVAHRLWQSWPFRLTLWRANKCLHMARQIYVGETCNLLFFGLIPSPMAGTAPCRSKTYRPFTTLVFQFPLSKWHYIMAETERFGKKCYACTVLAITHSGLHKVSQEYVRG